MSIEHCLANIHTKGQLFENEEHFFIFKSIHFMKSLEIFNSETVDVYSYVEFVKKQDTTLLWGCEQRKKRMMEHVEVLTYHLHHL